MSTFRLVNIADVKYDRKLVEALHRKYPDGIHPQPGPSPGGLPDQIIFPVMPRREGLILLAFFDAFVQVRDAGVPTVLVWMCPPGSDRDLDEMVEVFALEGF